MRNPFCEIFVYNFHGDSIYYNVFKDMKIMEAKFLSNNKILLKTQTSFKVINIGDLGELND